MAKVKKQLHWIEEWQQQSHITLPSSAPRRLDLVKPSVSTLPPPAFLRAVPSPVEVAPPPFENKEFLQPDPFETASLPLHVAAPSQPLPYSTKPSYPPSKRSLPSRQRVSWFQEEITFTMNKLSIFGLVFGLMLLGTLLFIGGFLTAYNFYARPHPSYAYNPWTAAHHPLYAHDPHSGHTPYTHGHETPPHNYVAGMAGYALHRQASHLNSGIHLPHIGGSGLLGSAAHRIDSRIQTAAHRKVNQGAQSLTAPLHSKYYEGSPSVDTRPFPSYSSTVDAPYGAPSHRPYANPILPEEVYPSVSALPGRPAYPPSYGSVPTNPSSYPPTPRMAPSYPSYPHNRSYGSTSSYPSWRP